jgi:hypothetical protein
MALKWPTFHPSESLAAALDEVLRAMGKVARLAPSVAAVALPCWAFWRIAKGLLIKRPGIGYDEQFFMWGGWSILKGLAPYRDFLEFKPPMTFLTHALALKLYGYEEERFRYFFLWLSLSSIAAFIGALVKRGCDVALCASLGLAMAYLFTEYHEKFLADTESIGLSFYLLGVAALIIKTRYRKTAEVFGGIFLTCASLSKEPFIPCVATTWVASYFLVYGKLSRGHVGHYIKYTALGIGAVIGVLCLYMVPTGAMSAYISTVRGYTRMFRDPQNGYCVLIHQFKPTGRMWDDLPLQWERIRKDFLNLATLGFVAPLFLASLVFLPRRSLALFFTASIAFACALYGLTASHCYFPHYYLMAESGLFFFLGAGIDAIGPALAFAGGSSGLWMRAVVLLTVGIQLWPTVEADLPPEVTRTWAPSEPAPGLFDFIRTHTSPQDKIFTTGPPGLYVYADRLSAVRESSIIDELIPSMEGDTDAEKLRPLYEELVRNQPKVIFLDPERANRKVRHLAGAISPFLSEYNYTKVNENLYVKP